MPLPIVPAMLGASKTDAATAAEITTGTVQQSIDTKVESLADTAKGALGDLLQGVGRVVNKALPAAIAASATLSYRGTMGSWQAFLQPISLVSKYMQISSDNSDRIGYPSHRIGSLQYCSGFVLCEHAAIEIDGTLPEQQQIVAFLERGFYIE